MLNSSVREALLASVRWRSPPVRFQRSQVSTVPKSELARLGPCRALRGRCRGARRAWCRRNRGRAPGRSCPGRAPPAPRPSGGRRPRRCAGPARRWRCGSAGRSARSQTSGRFPLVGDADGGDVGGGQPGPGQRLRGHADLGGPDLLGVVLHPAGLREISGGIPSGPATRTAPSWSKTMARELVVPWSRARM